MKGNAYHSELKFYKLVVSRFNERTNTIFIKNSGHIYEHKLMIDDIQYDMTCTRRFIEVES